MARRDKSLLRLDAVRVEGALIQPDIVASAASGAAEGQSPESYGIDRGLNLRDEIGRAYLIAKGLWASFQEGRGAASPDAVHRALANGVLTKVLGFEFPHRRRFSSKEGSDLDLLQAAGGVPVAIAGTEGIDRVEIVATVGGDPIRRSATTLIQGELNSREGALWGVATNGLGWRILRDNESITRPGYIEIDLARIFRDDLYSDFTAFWLIAHRSRFPQEGAAGSDCVLEVWRHLGREQGVTAREDLRKGVEKALFHFGRGFVESPANEALVDRLNAGGNEQLTKDNFFRQLLRLVYRLIFVMTAEDREILHPDNANDAGKAIYANGYATGRLRERSRNRLTWDRHHDAYEGMKAVFRALRHGEPKLALPALGGLFASDPTPDLDGAQLTNSRFLRGLFSIAWLRRDGALSRINWRDMETEEFGSVYESLLELTPVISDGGRMFSFLGEADDDEADPTQDKVAGKKAKGNERKTTGSYYTPESLVQLLLNEALDPVIDRKVAEGPDDPESLLTLKVIDPACGSGHFIIAAARKIARKLAELRHGGSPTIGQYRHALRDVARRCIHGVDRNPMAVELCKVAIWIETVEPGKPLTFMDQKVRCGDSLVGVYDFACLAKGIPDEAYALLSGDDKVAAAHYKRLNAKQRDDKNVKQGRLAFLKPPEDLVRKARRIEVMPEDNLAEIAKKREEFEAWQTADWINQKWACDLWTAAFFIAKSDVPPSQGLYEVPLTDNVWKAWNGSLPLRNLEMAVQKAASEGAFLHWPLVFADIIEAGGFDCVIGNPPWEKIKLQEQEFFSRRDDEIASAPTATRAQLIARLRRAPKGTHQQLLYEEFESARRAAEAASAFARTSTEYGGRFPLTAHGDINTYALFSELFKVLMRADGRIGVITKAGLLTDFTNRHFISSVIDGNLIRRVVGFTNARRLFPAVHPDTPFIVLILGCGESKPTFSFNSLSVEQSEELERQFQLSASDFKLFNPNTRAIPSFRSSADASLSAKIFRRFSVLAAKEGDLSQDRWPVQLRTMFHKSNASREGHIVQLSQISNHKIDPPWLPVHEGEYGFQYDHRYATFSSDRVRSVTEIEHKDTSFEPSFEFVANANQYDYIVSKWDRFLSNSAMLAFRRVSNAGNDRTAICALLPRGACTYGWILVTGVEPIGQAMLCANFNSLVFDYLLRSNLSQPSVPQSTFEQIAVLPPSYYSKADAEFVVKRVLELSYTSRSLTGFAREMGYDGPPFEWKDERRAVLRAELDAFYARAYDLTHDELRYILDPADVRGDAYPSETFRVLKQHEIARYKEYRTRRLVLEAWDRQSTELSAA